jgi:hypothetical protein
LRALQTDAERLRNLPRPTLGPDFAEQVLQAIAGQNAESARHSALALPSHLPVWLGLATAAAVLLAIGLGSYYYFAAGGQPEQAPIVLAANQEQTSPPTESIPSSTQIAPPAAKPSPPELLHAPALQSQVTASAPPSVPNTPDEKSQAEPKQPTFGSPLREGALAPLKDPNPRLSRVFNLREFDSEKQKQLQEELQKSPAHWVDLRCTETVAGMERLRTAFEAQGVQFVLNQDAEAVLKLRMGMNPAFAIYLDDVTAGEMITILQQFSSEDRKREPGRRHTVRFESLVVNTMGREEQQNLSRLLGIDPRQLDAPVRKAQPGVNIAKPIAKLTEEQVLAFLKGQGTPRSESAKPAGKALDRSALVVMYAPDRFRTTSAEGKRFLENRKERRPDAVQILLVLHPAKR